MEPVDRVCSFILNVYTGRWIFNFELPKLRLSAECLDVNGQRILCCCLDPFFCFLLSSEAFRWREKTFLIKGPCPFRIKALDWCGIVLTLLLYRKQIWHLVWNGRSNCIGFVRDETKIRVAIILSICITSRSCSIDVSNHDRESICISFYDK